MKQLDISGAALVIAATAGLLAVPAAASSHREAPFVTEHPKVDATDFYMFRSYEEGRDGFVTLIANYLPLQDAYGGPNYFFMDPEARYDLHIDNSGDGKPNITFRFQFKNVLQDLKLPVGSEMVSVPLLNIGPQPDLNSLNIVETFSVTKVGEGKLRVAGTGDSLFVKPTDNVGHKSFADYQSYADSFIYDVAIPGCDNGRLFVGQRKESFAVNLGEVFDLVNINPVGEPDAEGNDLDDKNITSLILEAPIGCLSEGQGDVIGGWTTASLPKRRTLIRYPTFQRPEFTSPRRVQVSRLGMPLVNEVVIGLKDKNRFNASQPSGDLSFATYVTNPTLPEILEILFGVQAPNNFPRRDLLATFVTGITGLNEFGFGEMQRLNTAISPTTKDEQHRLGVIGGDNAGFPNGRRPGDDVVDIELRVAMGGTLPYTDGALQSAEQFDDAFPYLTTPIPGSPN
jgi:hypothetical protein